ncbi:conserved hypothetical protein [Rippkaea orientalis PCC 8801]|uniref:DUF2973 domain-containing protein n=1 Tax=Rippkaea orientalis (strain PCC 8801 / RF-1) TaxID=41431 RepID=B7K1T5_RIPO1|nr:DUF2973 domain-containing protein [Rippkaea orientalis]ACK64242.1 conserved hypothetical protein [Rippkaea orientalis PCC 8801]
MLHLLYILAFTIIAFLAVSNLIRSLITVSMDSQRRYPSNSNSSPRRSTYASGSQKTIHPELLDNYGNPINEPLLVMRSVTVEDARQQLDALYNSSPSQPQEKGEES